MAAPSLKKRYKSYFLTGLLVLLPVVVSLEIVRWLLTYLDDILRPYLEDFFGEYIFGVGIVLILLLVVGAGMFAQNYLGRKVVRFIERVFDRLPVIRTVYSVVRQLIEPFSSESGKSFRQAVMVEYPMKDRYSVGFIANEQAGRLGDQDLVTVFVPSNHLHLGYLVIMPARDIIPIDMGVEEVLKLVVSCGIVVAKPLGHAQDVIEESAAPDDSHNAEGSNQDE